MFRDIEAPKYTMLENERNLDEQDGEDWPGTDVAGPEESAVRAIHD